MTTTFPKWIGVNDITEPAPVHPAERRPTNDEAHAAKLCKKELIAVLKRHGFCLENEDTWGGFLLLLRGDVDANYYDARIRTAELVVNVPHNAKVSK